jgi:small-conductance mechanosensitive channel
MDAILKSWHTLKEFPEYLPAAEAALAILILAVPVYLGLWYFLYRRRLPFSWRLQVACLGDFVLFAGLAFLFASPWGQYIIPWLRIYLFVVCVIASYCIVTLIDVFLLQHYLSDVRRVYISPPLRKVINISVFCLTILPILHYVLHFNPFTLVAIPTIATAGIALAFQDTLKAFFAGIGLGRLIRVGDWVALQDKEGRVTDIKWGRTVLRTVQGDLLFIPNTLLLTQPFYNYSSHHAHRLTLKIGVSYTISPARVKAVMEQCALNVPDILSSPKPVAQLLSFNDASIHYGLFYWVEDYGRRYETHDALATRIWEAFQKEGFELPFPFPVKPLPSAPAARS